MPYKSDGKYHFDGEIQTCTTANLKGIFGTLKPDLLKCKCHLVITPPMPQHLHDRCCASTDHCTNVGSEKHAEKILGNISTIRTACITNLELIGAKNFSVPDIIKISMPACIGLSEYAAALKSYMQIDGVHFTNSGYACFATGISTHIKLRNPEKCLPLLLIFQAQNDPASSRSTGEGSCPLSVPAGPRTTKLPTSRATPTPWPEEAGEVGGGGGGK
jgi:hypothetical protein